MIRILRFISFIGAVVAVISATSTAAQVDWRANYELYGTQGIVDIPSALAPSDAEFAMTLANCGDTQRATFTFQALPRLTGGFRYSLIDSYDRSFYSQCQIADEGQYRPVVAAGQHDFLGT